MTLARLLLRTLRCTSVTTTTVNLQTLSLHPQTPNPISLTLFRSFAFSSIEEAATERRRRSTKRGPQLYTFITTDNTCGPEPPLMERLEKKAVEGEKFIIKEAEEIEEEVEKEVVKVRDTEVSLFQRLMEGFKELQQDEEYFLKELSKEEKELLNDLQMEASEVEKLFGRALPIRKLR